ncbi:hypothetical protein C8F01DRAFT_1181638 [Mycena amicta]|nr:hypothetical protein C8F01DRAFT_1181638 [Mycena amicta]
MSVSSRTPLRGHRRATQSLSLPFAVVAALQPKRTRNRTSILALLALITLAAFVLCSYFPLSLPPTYLLRVPDGQHKQQPTNGYVRQPISLSPAQELAAVSSFLASLPQNVIPPVVRWRRSIRVVEYVWAQNPVMLYCKHYSSLSRELKAMLSDLNLRPPPFIVDVDLRDDADVLIPLLIRLTDTPELPILLVGGKPMGSMDAIRIARESGLLQRHMSAAGAVIGGGGKRRKNHH